MLINVNPFIRPKLSVLPYRSVRLSFAFAVIISGIQEWPRQVTVSPFVWMFLQVKIKDDTTTLSCYYRNYSQKLLQKHWQSCFAWHDLPLRPPREHLCFSISDTIRVTPGQTINTLKTRSPLPLGLGGSVGLSILSDTKWVVWFLSSKAWACYQNFYL